MRALMEEIAMLMKVTGAHSVFADEPRAAQHSNVTNLKCSEMNCHHFVALNNKIFSLPST
jgi:hypothetical protein